MFKNQATPVQKLKHSSSMQPMNQGKRQVKKSSTPRASYMERVSVETKADNGILIHEIEVKYAGEPIRVKPFKERANKESVYFLCNHDQNLALITKTVHFYKSPSKGHEGSIVEVISNSLSKVLPHYYPLAGKFGISPEGELIVECTDEGVMLMEAKANCVLEDVFPWLDHVDTMQRFVYDVHATTALEIPPMTAQVTRFRCGGFIVGIAMHHCMADGISEGEFFKNWGLIARGLPLHTPPFLDRTILIKIRDPPTPNPRLGFLQTTETLEIDSLYDNLLEYRSFVFDEEKILRLKSMAMEESIGVSKCSTFEVLTAFVWRARTNAFNVQPNQQINLLFAVDIRSKFRPSLPKGFFGNAVVMSNSVCTAGELLGKNFSYAVKLVQEAKKIVNENYVKSFINCFDSSMVRQPLTTTLMISTWCHLALDAMDFGLGEPIYAGPAVLPMKEGVLFLPLGKKNQGIIIKIGLPHLAMKAFEELVMLV